MQANVKSQRELQEELLVAILLELGVDRKSVPMAVEQNLRVAIALYAQQLAEVRQ